MIKRPVTIAQARQWPASAARRRSFCARMGGMRDQLTGEEAASDSRSRINRALAAWDCDIPELLDRKHISRGIRMRKNPSGKPTPYRVRYYSPATRRVEYVANQRLTKANAIEIARLLDFEGFERIEVSFYAPELGRAVPVEWRKKNPDPDAGLAWDDFDGIDADHFVSMVRDRGGGFIDTVATQHRKNPAPKRQQTARIRTTMPDGSKVIETVPILFRFTVYIGNVAEKFHARKDQFNQLVVTEESTGLSVGTVPAMTRASALGNDRLAAESFVERTAERVGAEKFRAAIAKAGPL